MRNTLFQNAAWAQIEQQQLEEAKKQQVKTMYAATNAALNDFIEQVPKIKGDPELSQAGRQSRLQNLAKKVDAIIDTATNSIITEAEQRIGEVSAILSRFVAGQADDSVRALLKVEARTCARRVDPLMLSVQYLQLARDGRDDLSCEAIEQAPFFDSLLKPDVLEEGKAIRAARHKPDLTAELRELRFLVEIVKSERASAKRELREYLPVEVPGIVFAA